MNLSIWSLGESSNDISTLTDEAIITIDHHLYDNLSDKCSVQRPKPQPRVEASIRTSPPDYHQLGFNLLPKTKTAAIKAGADTGCQSCLVELLVVNQLGQTNTIFISMTVKMRAANSQGTILLHAIQVTDTGIDGCTRTTRQMTYVTECQRYSSSAERLALLSG